MSNILQIALLWYVVNKMWHLYLKESMETFWMGNELWGLVVQSDGITKAVLSLLLFFSVICWAVFFGKALICFLKKRQLNTVLKRLHAVTSVEQVLEVAADQIDTFPGYILTRYFNPLKPLLQSALNESRSGLYHHELTLVQKSIDQTTDTVIERGQSYMSVLSTTAAVAPLLGLFGTVWGLIHAFLRISDKQVADIITVAPGIAEALMTTLAGLLVAIPALILFNYIQSQLSSIEQSIIELSDIVSMAIQKKAVQKEEKYDSFYPSPAPEKQQVAE